MDKVRKCPFCGEEIFEVALKCKHCGEWLSSEDKSEVRPPQLSKAAKLVTSAPNPNQESNQKMMGFFDSWMDAIVHHYADFRGKASRWQFWSFILVYNLIGLGLGISLLFGSMAFILVNTLFCLVIFIPSLSLNVRRMHDIGKSGWGILITLIPLIGFIWYIVLCCKKGETADSGRWNIADTIKTFMCILLFVVGVSFSNGADSLNFAIEYNGNEYQVNQLADVVDVNGNVLSDFDLENYNKGEIEITEIKAPFCVISTRDPQSPYIDDFETFIGHIDENNHLQILVYTKYAYVRIYATEGSLGAFSIHESGSEFNLGYIYSLNEMAWKREKSLDHYVNADLY